jgi:lysophospholipase L1-like esterase
VTTLSREGMGRAGWVPGDGLHPGDEQYRAWAQLAYEQIAAGPGLTQM